jgi:hypothetical protein
MVNSTYKKKKGGFAMFSIVISLIVTATIALVIATEVSVDAR